MRLGHSSSSQLSGTHLQPWLVSVPVAHAPLDFLKPANNIEAHASLAEPQKMLTSLKSRYYAWYGDWTGLCSRSKISSAMVPDSGDEDEGEADDSFIGEATASYAQIAFMALTTLLLLPILLKTGALCAQLLGLSCAVAASAAVAASSAASSARLT